MCPQTTIYVFSYYYIYALKLSPLLVTCSRHPLADAGESRAIFFPNTSLLLYSLLPEDDAVLAF
jgi:hypothetical protein